MNKFASRLKKELEINKISQVELANTIGVSKSIISQYCSGKKEPTLDTLMLICNALNESADYLIGLID